MYRTISYAGISRSVLLALAAAACADEPKHVEEELDLLEAIETFEAKADSPARPTDHGAIVFGAASAAELTARERFHAWSFELTGAARVTMATGAAVRGQRRTDTVLYLYREREGGGGWGRAIARNDDHGGTVYSRLERDLGAGRYRVLVKGYTAATRGRFALTVGCEGGGCEAAAAACVFGSTYRDIAEAPALQIASRSKITAATLGGLSPVEQQQLVVAVQQSSHTDVMTPEEALARVDQQEINAVYIVEPAARRGFLAFEYGVGDNSYGAIFERGGGELVSSIHDGDLLGCAVAAEVCLLPADFRALRMDPAFTRMAARVVAAPAELSELEAAQALVGFREVYGEGTTLAEGFERIDGGALNLVSFTHGATGRRITAVEHGAGDTSVGAVFYEGTTERAARIRDLAIQDCTMFAD